MLVALMRLDLRIPGCRSLKEKRQVVKSLIGGIRSKFNVSVAESGYQDLWQRSELAVAIAAGEGHHARTVASEVLRFIETFPKVEVLDHETTVHSQDD